jgi:membrane protein DedA with SNARE-associated domain
MPQFLTNIGLLAGQNQFLAYFIVYIATIFLGNISAFAAFWMVFRGFFGLWGVPLLVLTIFLANISGDLLWYSLGFTLRDTRLGNFIRNRIPRHEKIEAKLQKIGTRIVFMSKFFYGSVFPLIFLVGWFKINFKKFFRMSVLSVLIWLPILTLLAFGLVSGLSPLRAVNIFKNFEMVFLVGIGLFIAADYFLARLFKKLFGKGFVNGNNNNNHEGGDNGSGTNVRGDAT